MILTCLCSLLANPQVVGGDAATLFQVTAPNNEAAFGRTACALGDVDADGFDDFALGAPSADSNSLRSSGAVFVYSGFNGALLFRIDGTESGMKLGSSLDGVGDINGDHHADILIGASGSDHNHENAGAAFVVSGANGNILHQWFGRRAASRFGHAVSCAGDVNADGVPDVIVGTWEGIGIGNNDPGHAYVFSGMDGSLLYEYQGSPNSEFGYYVSDAGDVDADGYGDIYIGGEHDPFSGIYSGQTGQLLIELETLSFIGKVANLEPIGDVNRDGHDDLGVLVLDEILMVSGSDFSLLHTLQIEFSGSIQFDQIGDHDHDGFVDFFVSQPNSSKAHAIAGAVRIISGNSGLVLVEWTGNVPSDYLGSNFAASIGDTNGDQRLDFLASAAGLTDSPIGAYVYSFNPILTTDTTEIPISTGATISLNMAFPSENANQWYKILLSESGYGPTLFGTWVPLGYDPLFLSTFLGDYPIPNDSGLHGQLDSHSMATVTVPIPPHLPHTLIGSNLYAAAVCGPHNILPTTSSVAVSFQFVP